MAELCEIQFEFEDKDRKFRAGETVAGHFVVTASKDMDIRDVHIMLGWHAMVKDRPYMSEKEVLSISSQGTHDRGSPSLSKTQWLAGRTYQVPFSFKAPVGPLSHKSEQLKIDWLIQARIDQPGEIAMFEPKVKAKIWIAAQTGQVAYLGPNYEKTPASQGLLDGGSPFLTVFTALIVAAIGWWYPATLNPDHAFSNALFFWAIMIVGSLLSLGMLMQYFSDRHLAKVFQRLELLIDSQQAMPGSPLIYKLAIQPRQDIAIKNVELHLKGREQVFGDHKNNQAGYTELFHEQKIELIQETTLPAQELLEKAGMVIVPKSAPYTFLIRTKDAETRGILITYELKFKIELVGGTTKSQTFQIDVVPWLEEKPHVDFEPSSPGAGS